MHESLVVARALHALVARVRTRTLQKSSHNGLCRFAHNALACMPAGTGHRVPGFAAQTGMKEHIDNGAMSRWADAAWQSVYAAILHVVSLPRCPFCCLSSSCLSSSCLSSSCLSSSGLSVSCRFIWPLFFWSLRLAKRALSLCLAHPDGCEEQQGKVDEYDAWKVGQRVSTKGSSTAFRSFQGWLALSPQVVMLCIRALAHAHTGAEPTATAGGRGRDARGDSPRCRGHGVCAPTAAVP